MTKTLHALGATLTILAVLFASAAGARAQDESQFRQDLETLTATPHRLAGTEEGHRAAAYIHDRLRAIGIPEDQIFGLDIPVWQTRVAEAVLEVGGQRVPLLPMHPNIIIPPTTGPEGLTRPLMYVGQGRVENYAGRSPEGHIVVLDYDSGDAWETAFALGADAVIFLGRGDETPSAPKHLGLPSNLIRMYASADALGGVDLTQSHPRATLRSAVPWERSMGRNIIARIPGTDPRFAAGRDEPEALVLAVHYDSFGQVPHLSPGARVAANVAALLETAQTLHRDPPRRDVILMFLDNQARYHQGARAVYDALLMPAATSDGLTGQHKAESEFLGRMRELLHAQGLEFRLPTESAARGPIGDERAALAAALRDRSDFRRDDLAKTLQIMRLNAVDDEAAQARLEAEEQPINDEILRWDNIRRSLHNEELALFTLTKRAAATGEWEQQGVGGLTPGLRERYEEAAAAFAELDPEAKAAEVADARAYLPLFDALVARTLADFETRLAELDGLMEMDRQREALRRGLGEPWIVLHATYNFSGGAPTWAVVVGDRTDQLYTTVRLPKPEGDTPGYYGRVLSAFRDAVASVQTGAAAPLALDDRSLTDPTLGMQLAPGQFFSSGYVAGLFGIYNVSLMTAYDARVRDGHPADTVANLPWQPLRAQALEATSVVRALADTESLSLPRVFKAFKRSKYPSWDNGRSSGDYVGLMVSGSLSENRPASGAMIATWPGSRFSPPSSEAWEHLQDAVKALAFQPVLLAPVDTNGRFPVIAYQSEMMNEVMTLGAIFDDRGRVEAISTRQHQAQKSGEAMRIDLMTGDGYAFSTTPVYELKANQLKVLRATADADFRPTRGLWGQVNGHGFFYVSDAAVEDTVKLFQPMGPVVLGEFDAENPYGGGVPVETFIYPPRLSPATAEDMWLLNEERFGLLRPRGVTDAALERIHAKAKRSLETAADESLTVGAREAALQRAAVLSHRVYQPLRTSMDDLVHAIVVLLLLAIPFAFALERLLVCATTIYGRIAGFTVFFLITFAILYMTHPGFAIASTPIIIFLAFAIILLSALVIYIVVRKFQTELKAMQGQGVGVHQADVSATGTLLAAVGMGMSTMRRRPTRTALTAITVVALTFTILCFASFSRVIGVRSVPAGIQAQETAPALLLRKLDYSGLPRGVLTMLSGMEGDGGMVAAHWWLVRKEPTAPPYTVTRVDDGRSVQLEAVMGVPARELDAWPALADALGPAAADEKRAAIERGEVFLPYIVQDMLGLEVGDEVLLSGHRVRFAGVIDGARLQTLKHLDGDSLIPVDFQTATLESTTNTQPNEEELLMADDVEKDFVHLSADQVAITSAERVRGLGGLPHLVSIYPGRDASGEEIDASQLGRDVAQVVVMPVWAAGREGVERLLLTVLTEVSGGMALFVPLLLGGLIIFGTLLGSIQDREKEIYTFSALGLSPGHVGVLFFAEAAVYAIVGGMGGQLLAQFVALSASALARAGYIQPASINYSSTNALFAIGVVMATVLISALYPALRASKSANPGLARAWKMPQANEDDLRLKFPFTVSAYDITGVVSFLAEHFRRHDDAGLGSFAASNVSIGRNADGNLFLESDLALAPFDLGVTQHMVLTAVPSEIEGVDEVAIEVKRLSGARGDWYRANKVFMRDLRKQFLLWRTLASETIEHYRMETLETLGEKRRLDEPSGGPENPTGVSIGPKTAIA